MIGGAFASTASAKKIVRCNGQKVLCNRPFNEIVLPGAHNAMSSASLDWVLPNQSVAIPDQLTMGIRGFLVDTHYGRLRDDGVVVTDDDRTGTDADGPLGTYFCHEYCQLGASKLAPCAAAVHEVHPQSPAQRDPDRQRGLRLAERTSPPR